MMKQWFARLFKRQETTAVTVHSVLEAAHVDADLVVQAQERALRHQRAGSSVIGSERRAAAWAKAQQRARVERNDPWHETMYRR